VSSSGYIAPERWFTVTVSTDSEPGCSARRTTFRSLAPLDSLSRYDLTLLVIPLAFLCALAVGSALPVPTLVSLVGASLFGAVVVTDALFLNPPTAR
jgi:hypothetical protein